MIELDGCLIWAETVTKFYNTVRISGWFNHRTETLSAVEVIADGLLAQDSTIGPVSATADHRFTIQYMTTDEGISPQSVLRVWTSGGNQRDVPILDLAADTVTGFRSRQIWEHFRQMLSEQGSIRILDVGGRNRSGSASRNVFPEAEYVTLDIVPGPEVSIVADAHDLRSSIESASFDAFISVSVFEHLMMPWTVVEQLNEVLRPGGLGFVLTHQSIGMHDMPWDFWRVSDTAWDALFNRFTGFEILHENSTIRTTSFRWPFGLVRRMPRMLRDSRFRRSSSERSATAHSRGQYILRTWSTPRTPPTSCIWP